MAKRDETRTTGPDAFAVAKRRARFGHRDWVVFRGRDGVLVADRSTPETIKEALLAAGVKGHWHLVAADSGHTYRMSWRLGINALAWARRRRA